MRTLLLVGIALVCHVALSGAEDGKLPDESRVSYQTPFPRSGPSRLPSFMDVFAAFSQTEYINVGLKWNVAESKAAMAYATRLSSGHKPIAEKTDDYHIEAFSKSEQPAPTEWTKIRFRQKDAYSGTIGYAVPDNQAPGLFQLWDNTKKDFAKLKLGDLQVLRNAEIVGDLTLKGKINTDVKFESKQDSSFAGTSIGITNIGSRIEAPEAKGVAIYTRPKGGKVDINKPRMFVMDSGMIGFGTTTPTAQLHIKADTNALRIESGKASVGETSVLEVDGLVQGKVAAGQRFMVMTNGNIGVNIRTPEEKLHVAGGLKVDSAGVFGPSKATLFVTNTMQKCDEHSVRVRDHFYVSACGKVGVMTPKPLAEFHVTGKTMTDFIDVGKDATITGTLTTTKFAPLRNVFEADTLKIVKDAQLMGKVQMDSDVVIKGNLFVEKEVKMVGGNPGEEMSEMMESRMVLLEESHKALEESHRSLQKWHKDLLESHDTIKKQNSDLQERVKDLENQLSAE